MKRLQKTKQPSDLAPLDPSYAAFVQDEIPDAPSYAAYVTFYTEAASKAIDIEGDIEGVQAGELVLRDDDGYTSLHNVPATLLEPVRYWAKVDDSYNVTESWTDWSEVKKLARIDDADNRFEIGKKLRAAGQLRECFLGVYVGFAEGKVLCGLVDSLSSARSTGFIKHAGIVANAASDAYVAQHGADLASLPPQFRVLSLFRGSLKKAKASGRDYVLSAAVSPRAPDAELRERIRDFLANGQDVLQPVADEFQQRKAAL